MDLRIDAKKFCSLNYSDIYSRNGVNGCPTPPPSNGSAPRTPSPVPSSSGSCGSSVFGDVSTGNTTFTSSGTYSQPIMSEEMTVKVEKVTPPRGAAPWDAKPSSQILKKLQFMKKPMEVELPRHKTLIYRPTDICTTSLNENNFITIDKHEFHDNKRIRVQEDDLLKEENDLKKFKPDEFALLAKSLKTTTDMEFLTSLLRSAISKSKTLEEANNSTLAWVGHLESLGAQAIQDESENCQQCEQEVIPSNVKGAQPGQLVKSKKKHYNRAFEILFQMDTQLLTLNANTVTSKVPPPRPAKVANPPVQPRPPSVEIVKVQQICPPSPQFAAWKANTYGNPQPVQQLPSPRIVHQVPSPKPVPQLPSPHPKQELQAAVKPLHHLESNSIVQELTKKYPYPSEQSPELLVIGPHGSTIPRAVWNSIVWTQTPALITRKILVSLFDKYTLATHNLSGRPSPAFRGIQKAEKLPLDAGKVADTISIVTSYVNVTPKEVRMAITTKCADECKMLRQRQAKKAKLSSEFVESFHAPTA